MTKHHQMENTNRSIADKRKSKKISVVQNNIKVENPEMNVVLESWIQEQRSNGYRVTRDIINPTLTKLVWGVELPLPPH